MKIFRLNRIKDTSGVSGVGIVAYGVEFNNGEVVLTWHGEKYAIEVLHSLSIVELIHGHSGNTIIEIFNPKIHGRYYKNIEEFINGDDLKKDNESK